MVDSGARKHVVSRRDLNSAELETMRISRNPTTVVTANGEVANPRRSHGPCQRIDLFVTVMCLEDTPAVLSVGKLCEDDGYTHHWTRGQKPHLTRNGKKINCKKSNNVPFFVPGLPTSSSTSSTPSSSTSSSQDSVIGTENPAAERSGSMSGELPGNPLQKPAETENPNKNEDDEEVQK